jgi:energy-coupling factor transporter transmembrane protein EcfT
MTSAFDPLLFAPSPLQRLDPRWKMAGLMWAAAVVSALGTLAVAGGAFLGALTLALVGRLPPRWYLARLTPVLFSFCSLYLYHSCWKDPEKPGLSARFRFPLTV